MRSVLAALLIAVVAETARADVRPMPVPPPGGPGLTAQAAVAGLAVAGGAAGLWLLWRRPRQGDTP